MNWIHLWVKKVVLAPLLDPIIQLQKKLTGRKDVLFVLKGLEYG